MVIRAALLFLIVAASIYSVLWLATFTPYFKNKGRLRRISKRSALIAVAGLLAWVVMVAFFIIDQTSN